MNHIKTFSRQSSRYLLETKKPSKMGVKPPKNILIQYKNLYHISYIKAEETLH